MKNITKIVFILVVACLSIDVLCKKKRTIAQGDLSQKVDQNYKDFVQKNIPSIKTLFSLESFLMRLDKHFQDILTEEEKKVIKEIVQSLSTPLTTSSKVKNQLTLILKQKVPSSIKNILKVSMEEGKIILLVNASIDEARKTKQDLGAILLKGIQKQFGKKAKKWPQGIKAIVEELESLQRTPKTLFYAIKNAITNKQFLSPTLIDTFYKLVYPYGILCLVFDYFVREVERLGTLSSQTLTMLLRSLECMNDPGSYFGRDIIVRGVTTRQPGKNKNLLDTAERFVKQKIANNQLLYNAPLASVIVDTIVDENYKGKTLVGLYSEQLKTVFTIEKFGSSVRVMGIYYKKLTNLIQNIIEKNSSDIIAQLKEFISKPGIISEKSKSLITFIKQVERAFEKDD